ncbi:MAG: baseplate J/gp47 family protein, partial [Anaerolineales bacterium]
VPTIARWLLFAAATGATLLMLALVAPSASIRLAPHVQHINAQLTLRADPTVSGIDAAAYTVPARTAEVQVEGTVQVPTTGAAEQATQRAQGTVTFTNLTDQPARVPAGTAVRTTSSLPTRFVTQQDVTLDAESGAKADVPILAVEPGPSGNVGPGLINAIEGPLELQVAVVNLHETGGGDVAIVSAVAAADRARARAQLEAELVQRGYGEIVSALRLGEFSPIATARIVDVADVAYDLESGDLGDALTLDMRATVVASVVNESDAFSIGRSELHARVGDSLELLAGTIHIERGEVLAADDTGAVEFEIVARGDAGPVIDPDEVRSTIRWKEYGHAQALLRSTFPVAQPPTVQIWPKWFPRMPWLAWRIAVDVTSDAASGS